MVSDWIIQKKEIRPTTNKYRDKTDLFEQLREKAKALLEERPGTGGRLPVDVLEHIDKLAIYQGELEIQKGSCGSFSGKYHNPAGSGDAGNCIDLGSKRYALKHIDNAETEEDNG